MRQVSRRWRESVAGVNHWTTVVEWTNDGGETWHDADLISGTVTADANSMIRWHCELVIRDPRFPVSNGPLDDSLAGGPADDFFGPAGINPFNTQIRVRHGLQWSANPGDRELLGMGLYRIATASRSWTDPHQLQVTGDSFESYLIQHRFPSPVTRPGEDATARLRDLVREVLSETSIFWDGVKSRRLPKTTIERERWEAIDGNVKAGSIAKALAARVYCDGAGVIVVKPIPTLDDPVTWTAHVGPGGMLIDSTEELTNEAVYNMIVVTGETTETSRDGGEETVPVGPAIVKDENPYSYTYVYRNPNDGGFGKCPFFYTSQLITTMGQARAAARGMLAPRLGLRQQVTFDSLHDPTKEPGDVGLVTGPDGSKHRVILDSVTYDLLGGPLQCETRTTRTSFGDDTADTSDDDTESEGEAMVSAL